MIYLEGADRKVSEAHMVSVLKLMFRDVEEC